MKIPKKMTGGAIVVMHTGAYCLNKAKSTIYENENLKIKKRILSNESLLKYYKTIEEYGKI
ncbi:MAG TPA: hypothetical protein DCP90_05065 [Clostridiales bacterium]|nr:MAG: hypothetical protein A2Y22_06195 [Clostridiales bacterium GWD2_32_59]HAN09969.1 hypothetical protein [Clostridiales bacterium]